MADFIRRWPMAAVACLVIFGFFVLGAMPAQAGVLDVIGTVATGGASVLSGGIIGGVLRLVPEVMRLFQAKGDRDHEYRMAQLSAEVSKAAQQAKLAEISAQGDMAYDNRALDALTASITAQGKPTGFWLVDALSAAVRPVVTYWWVGLYSVVKLSQITLAMSGGASGADAVLTVWTAFDMETFGAILNFWFLDRVLRHRPL